MKQTIRELLRTKKSILIPVAHDALTAKLIERAGFDAFSIGGFGVAAASYGLPDNGSLTFKDFSPVFRNIISASSLPVLVDADTGYGGPQKAASVVASYEALGASVIFIEDQQWPKRCGHAGGQKLISKAAMCGKIKAAKAALVNVETILMARTDAIAAEGSLDAAIDRARDYVAAGADAIFIEGPTSIDDLKRIPRELTNTILLVNMMEGGKTPIVPHKILEEWGYHLIAYPITTILSQTKAVEESLARLKERGTTNDYFKTHMTPFSDFRKLIGL